MSQLVHGTHKPRRCSRTPPVDEQQQHGDMYKAYRDDLSTPVIDITCDMPYDMKRYTKRPLQSRLAAENEHGLPSMLFHDGCPLYCAGNGRTLG